MRARYCKRVGEALLLPGTIAFLVSVCSLAHAQAWLPDRNYTEGPGIKAGDQFEIHGGVAARAGWNSNVYYANGGSVPRQSSGLISVTPHVNISTRGKQREQEGEETQTAPPKIRLRSGADVTVLHYTANDMPNSNVDVGVDGTLEIMPQRTVGGEISASYSRSIQPFTQNVASGDNYLHNNLAMGALVRLQSKGGVLQGSAGYRPAVDLFGAETVFSYLNGYAHVVPLSMTWRFLPHTALVYDGDLRFKHFTTPVGESMEAAVLYSDSRSFRSRLGLNGAITKRLSLQVMGGAAFGFYDPTETSDGDVVQLAEYQEPLAQATLTWTFLGRGNKLQLGYEHEVSPSYVGGWVKRDRGEITLNLAPASVVALEFRVGGGQYHYGNMLDEEGNGLGQDGSDERTDLRLDAAVRAEYRVTHWLAFMADATLILSDSDFAYDNVNDEGNPIVDPASYTVFKVFGGVRAHY